MKNHWNFVIALAYQANAAQNTLEDCLATASLFDNTCDGTSTPFDWEDHAGKTMSCTGIMNCPTIGSVGEQVDYTSSNPCTYVRKLCVTCSEVDGEVFVRV